MATIYQSTNPAAGAIAMGLTMSDQLHAIFFKPGAWNQLVRQGLLAAGWAFITKYEPMRFTNYARWELGYSAKTKKGMRSLPLVNNGTLRERVLSQSWPEARVTTGNATLTLHIVTGSMIKMTFDGWSWLKDGKTQDADMSYTANPMVYKVLSSITVRECEMMGKVMAETISALAAGAEYHVTRKGTVSAAFTPTQRAGFKEALAGSHRGAFTLTRKAS